MIEKPIAAIGRMRRRRAALVRYIEGDQALLAKLVPAVAFHLR